MLSELRIFTHLTTVAGNNKVFEFLLALRFRYGSAWCYIYNQLPCFLSERPFINMSTTRETVFTVFNESVSQPNFFDTYGNWVMLTLAILALVLFLVGLIAALNKKIYSLFIFALVLACSAGVLAVNSGKTDAAEEFREGIVAGAKTNQDTVRQVATRHLAKYDVDYVVLCQDNAQSVICGGDDLSTINVTNPAGENLKVMLYPDYQNYPEYKKTGTIGIVFTVLD